MLFSLRLDETGTDGTSTFTTVGGAVGLISGWSKLERAWDAKLATKEIDAFHLVDFDQRRGQFEGWSDFKCQLLEKSLSKIVDKNTTFRAAISIDSAAHAAIKAKMKGIKGFSPESDYGLCLRFLMYHSCENLVRIDPDCQLSILVEDGPWASGAATTYQRVAAMTGKWKPAKHAHRLVGFASLPKGRLRSLEAADFVVGREHDRLVAGKSAIKGRETLSHLLSADDLEAWYDGMIEEKARRRAFGWGGAKEST